MSGLLQRLRAPISGRRSARRERGGDTAFAFAGSLVGLSSAGLGGRSIASARPTSLPAVDGPLVGVVFTLVLIGTVMVYSASISLADSPRYNVTPTHFLLRHLLSLGIAFCAAAIAFQIPIGVWQRLAPFVFVGALALLVVVLIPGVGKGVNGAKRWIPLGILNLQPSELMKVACVLYAANFTVRKQDYMNHFGKGFLPMAFVMGAHWRITAFAARSGSVRRHRRDQYGHPVSWRRQWHAYSRVSALRLRPYSCSSSGCRRGGASASSLTSIRGQKAMPSARPTSYRTR